MPRTEQSFMKALFHGIIAEDMIFPFPEMRKVEAERVALYLERIRGYFSEHVDSEQIDAEEAIPEAVLSGLKGLGLWGLQISDQYGGLGYSTYAYARILQEVAGLDNSIALTLGAHQSIGFKAIELFGSPELKSRYLPKLASGEWTAAFALTEPSAGSDAAAVKTRAELSADGTHYVLSGSKLWVTNGGFADVFTVFARTSVLEEGAKPKITAFIVDRSAGVRSGPALSKLGICGTSTTEVFFDRARVPASNVLGEAGKGFKVAMEVLNRGRLDLSAGAVGICATLIKQAIGRVQERRTFGRNIGEFGMIKDKIATMLSQTYALESATYLTTAMADDGESDYSLESAICKILGSETVWSIAHETMQIAAGSGYMRSHPYERWLRDARIYSVFEGTNEILRCFIALSGMAGPGRSLFNVAKAMREPIKGFGLLSDFALRKAKTVISRERISRAHPLLGREAVIFEEFTTELAAHVENVLRKHADEISEMQFTQRRIADIAVDLYALSACISRTTRAIERRGEDGARREIDLTSIFATMAQKRLRQNVFDTTKNDDELRKVTAGRSYLDHAYPFDVLG